MKRAITVAVLAVLLVAPLAAQERAAGGNWSALRVSKWLSFTATAAAAVYGVTTIQRADDSYERLELACQTAPTTCESRLSDGSYTDPDLEQQYRAVLREDRRARNALLASQLGVAATVVLFVLDLRHARPPADIPYEPRRLEISPRPDGRVELRLNLPTR